MSSTYEVGDLIGLDFTVTVGTTLTNATVTLTVTLPDGTTANPAITNPSTGTYHADYLATQNGEHGYRWVATGAATAAQSGSFTIGGLVSLAEAKNQLNIPTTDTTNDTELQGFIDAARIVAEDLAGIILPRIITGEVHDGGDSTICLRRNPVLSIQSITEYIGVSPFALTSQPLGQTTGFYGYELIDAAGGIVLRRGSAGYPMPFQGGPRSVVVSYTAGYALVPEPIRLGALVLIQHWWQNTQQGFGITPGAYGVEDTSVAIAGYAVPNYCAQLFASLPTSAKRLPGIA